MKGLDVLGLGRVTLPPAGRTATEIVQTQPALRRILAFAGKSIDDVVNERFAKNMVYGYYKLAKTIERNGEVLDLEHQWNNR